MEGSGSDVPFARVLFRIRATAYAMSVVLPNQFIPNPSRWKESGETICWGLLYQLFGATAQRRAADGTSDVVNEHSRQFLKG